ncbi:MAG: hypothetical protein ACJ0Q6_04990 [Candidatus Azotimanducaceae bacterium]|uniref:Uncharacterized protein n=1 Tax=OM182 bacterium TaxID=2510334 RepID=A0A520RYS5_9GAMM|nr:hypothetical protein [Gammaproteobacteria bacterium]RZO75337.1 MAG: hypothetical protein EVA68_07220 [OM182 bacterium]
MISEDIALDKLIADIDEQIEVLGAIAGDSSILIEQFRILQECRDALVNQNLNIQRLSELIDEENHPDFTTILEANQDVKND